jgi:hypothetical protein
MYYVFTVLHYTVDYVSRVIGKGNHVPSFLISCTQNVLVLTYPAYEGCCAKPAQASVR